MEYMFINNSEQCDWIRQQFETPGAMELSKGDKVLAWTRLLRAHKYVLWCFFRNRFLICCVGLSGQYAIYSPPSDTFQCVSSQFKLNGCEFADSI